MKNPALVGKQGNISQLGGDFIFGPGNTCLLAYRMRHTEDRACFLYSCGVIRRIDATSTFHLYQPLSTHHHYQLSAFLGNTVNRTL